VLQYINGVTPTQTLPLEGGGQGGGRKAHQPGVKYLVPSPHGYLLCDHLVCQAPMRLSRCGARLARDPTVNFGQYFKGITDVISRDDYKLLVDATARQLARDISVADIEEILIYAEKHGSDYHPARIEVMAGGVCTPFVMNVAVTARGKARLCGEFEVLQYLNSKYDYPFLPRTYFLGEAFHPSMLMFLAEWFQGYHEFHLSMDKEDGSRKLVLWDTDKDRCHLSRAQVWQIYSQAARLLTLYYDLETFEQIFPWHHAAGDFVVKAHPHPALPLGRGGFGWGWIDVRLVTARQYAPMVDRCAGVSAHEALLLFLLNLSVRMRLDRLDGVGVVAWADDDCVDATLEGFFEGLGMKQRKGAIGMGFVNGLVEYIRSLAKEDLLYRLNALVDSCDQAAPDMPLIRRHFHRHISKIYFGLQDLRSW